MKKIFPFIVIYTALCLGCGSSGHSDEYDEGYNLGYDVGREDAIQDALYNMVPDDKIIENVRGNYDICDVYTEEEIREYVREEYAPNDLYEYDVLIDCLTDAGYAVTEAPEKELFYVGNMNTHVYHRPKCKSVSKMNTHNVKRASKEQLENEGYTPCQNCEP